MWKCREEQKIQWLQEEIKIVADCLAEKRETGILGLMVKINNFVSDAIFDRIKVHHDTTDKVRKMRAEFAAKSESDLKKEFYLNYFSFIK